jgi:hypothetical protein
MIARPKGLVTGIVVKLKHLSSCLTHFHSLRDLSCKKLKEKEREEAMNEKKKNIKEMFIY